MPAILLSEGTCGWKLSTSLENSGEYEAISAVLSPVVTRLLYSRVCGDMCFPRRRCSHLSPTHLISRGAKTKLCNVAIKSALCGRRVKDSRSMEVPYHISDDI